MRVELTISGKRVSRCNVPCVNFQQIQIPPKQRVVCKFVDESMASKLNMLKMRPLLKKLVIAGAAAGVGALVTMQMVPKLQENRRMRRTRMRPPPSPEEVALFSTPLPTREANIEKMMKGDEIFDILVIGGGATGTGVALDAVSRVRYLAAWVIIQYDLNIVDSTTIMIPSSGSRLHYYA
ncbi:unnamed protein product [Dibothriocephalus latus]|uniref:Glycerol-3-phosphate dehydrogenase n=1 Tax=Dibothriocephalus latus TaxID=60516 RepID=A0A3P7NU54_DIBLA|nr:unnamed protein product [Dibothriocephalus latus]